MTSSSLTSSAAATETADSAIGDETVYKREPQPWHGAFAKPAKEFPPTDLEVLAGRIPEGLQGTFYQNGTGRLERGGQPVGHWFDGDGAILRVQLSAAGAKATYRYVQTTGYKAESKADRFLFGNYGMRSPGPLWKHMLGLFNGTTIKNSANTSVLALEDKLLALWEAGNPHSLDLETLETIGMESLGWLKPTQPFSAHPLRDPISGEIYSIGVNSLCELSIYRCDASGGLIKQQAIALKNIPLVHSFVIAGPYLVFLVSPVKVNPLPLLLNQLAYADAVKWDPNQGTRIIVVARESLEIVSDSYADPWFQWHYGNGCTEADGSIRLDYARFDDFTHINEVLREVPSGRMKTQAYGRLWQLRLDPKTGRVLSHECVVERDCEFPQVPDSKVGQPWEQTYVLMHREGVKTGEDWFGAVGRFDYKTQQLTQADLGTGIYGSEPLHVADGQTAENASEGWLLMVVYNSVDSRSELWIFEAKGLGEPVCRLALPGVIPIGFHGTWQSS
ncbi:carotenoid oxygenase family protein [cf. Phormidesmis sp. LEGE 11477]|uniref:carotenoid oxygenase family protein n=1 Tax=cf. Phormidesmis sp. LEGE 11477 TaxID=1828680 RepID=UPI00187EFC0C|nr:carotenoid oxygenase family protein [cf. Phormidesmis sp. LEGE 11477]MBE9061728.1 carotenoid oxygenase family protein [cf. Phormidesmis sp. LEGE 11477]